MRTEECSTKHYYIMGVIGIYQRWKTTDPKVLTDPRPFEGYVCSTEYAYSVTENINAAYRFEQLSTWEPSAKDFGPWWYKATEWFYIEVDEELHIKRTILPKPK